MNFADQFGHGVCCYEPVEVGNIVHVKGYISQIGNQPIDEHGVLIMDPLLPTETSNIPTWLAVVESIKQVNDECVYMLSIFPFQKVGKLEQHEGNHRLRHLLYRESNFLDV